MSLQGLPTELLLNIRDFAPSIHNLALTSKDINSALGGRDACIEHLLRRALHSVTDAETQLNKYWQTSPLSLRSFFVYLPQAQDELYHLCCNTFYQSYPKASKDALFESLGFSDNQKIDAMINKGHYNSFELDIFKMLSQAYSEINPYTFSYAVNDIQFLSILQEFSKPRPITHVSINDPSQLSKTGIEQLNQFPFIRSLSIEAPLPDGTTLLYIEHFHTHTNGRLPFLPNLTHLAITGSSSPKIIRCPVSSLEKIILLDCDSNLIIKGINPETPVKIGVLNIQNCGKKLPPINLSHIVVRELRIESCPDLTDIFLTQNGSAQISKTITIRDCPKLECCSIWNDRIERLSIGNCSNLDEYALACNNLTYFEMKECAALPIFSAALQKVEAFVGANIGKKTGSEEEVEFPASLKICVLGDCYNLKSMTTKGNALKSLTIEECPLLDKLEVPSTNLQLVTLCGLPFRAIKSDRDMEADDLARIPRPYVEFSLSAVKNIALQLKDLEYLDVSKCDLNTTTLQIHNCSKLTTIIKPIIGQET